MTSVSNFLLSLDDYQLSLIIFFTRCNIFLQLIPKSINELRDSSVEILCIKFLFNGFHWNLYNSTKTGAFLATEVLLKIYLLITRCTLKNSSSFRSPYFSSRLS